MLMKSRLGFLRTHWGFSLRFAVAHYRWQEQHDDIWARTIGYTRSVSARMTRSNNIDMPLAH